jgi:hypothetical protein
VVAGVTSLVAKTRICLFDLVEPSDLEYHKHCFKCLELKPITAFYKHPETADGHLGKCKECAKSNNVENRGKNIDHYRKYDRDRNNGPERTAERKLYEQSERGREVVSQINEKWNKNNPIKRKAQGLVRKEVSSGRLKPEPCKVCGDVNKVHGHHPDYSKPLHVVWLCPKHHVEEHRLIEEGKQRYF